jgi:hypothetical protein
MVRYTGLPQLLEDVMPKQKTAEKPEETTVQQAQPQPSQERQPGDEPAEESRRPFQPVRGWTSRFQGPVKYQKFTDANLKIIAFKFQLEPNEKLPDEVLAVMREHKKDQDGNFTGLKFVETRKHGLIWSLPNDVEGRTVADRIDYRLSEVAHKMEEQGRALS